jgi:SAM-dependent methyltransferase
MKILKPRTSARDGKPSEHYFGLDAPSLTRLMFSTLLEREPEKEALDAFSEMIESGAPLRRVAETILNSDEFLEKYIRRLSERLGEEDMKRITDLLKEGKINPALHDARKKMICTLLPKAKTILDLGGADSADPKGALLVLGYPYTPDEIDIVDLPPAERIFPVSEFEGGGTEFQFGRTTVTYFYHSMTELARFPSGAYDFVWSGESLEHIGRDEMIAMLDEVLRVLKPGGSFCFDMPNRDVTRLQAGDKNFIHPEHKYEYRYEEITSIIERAGFIIIKTHGLIAMHSSIEQGGFIVDEFLSSADKDGSLNAAPEKSYLMFFHAKKPE